MQLLACYGPATLTFHSWCILRSLYFRTPAFGISSAWNALPYNLRYHSVRSFILLSALIFKNLYSSTTYIVCNAQTLYISMSLNNLCHHPNRTIELFQHNRKYPYALLIAPITHHSYFHHWKLFSIFIHYI